jgi:type II secretory pathway pseudopilin PulG
MKSGYTLPELLGTIGIIALIAIITIPAVQSSITTTKNAKASLAAAKIEGAKVDFEYDATKKQREDFNNSPEAKRLEKIGKYLGGETPEATAQIVSNLLQGSGKTSFQVRELGKETLIQ